MTDVEAPYCAGAASVAEVGSFSFGVSVQPLVADVVQVNVSGLPRGLEAAAARVTVPPGVTGLGLAARLPKTGASSFSVETSAVPWTEAPCPSLTVTCTTPLCA